jgi:hypothetical protein
VAAAGPSRWERWETPLKVIASVVALLTAIVALIKGFQEMGWLDSKSDAQAEQTVQAQPAHSSAENKRSATLTESGSRSTRKAASQPAPTRPRPVATSASSSNQRPSPPPPASSMEINRPAFTIRMPAKREYTSGHGINDGRFMLLGATLTPQTPESDLLKFQWRFISRSPYQMELRSSDFTLRVSNDLIRPEHSFIHSIPSRESREGELDFVLNANTPKVTLRFGAMGIWEIPLELVPEPEVSSGAPAWNADQPGRDPFDIKLPEKNEYTVGSSHNRVTFTLLGARVTPKTPESDEILIQWRMVPRGTYATNFNNFDIWLNADGKEVTPEQSFAHTIPPGDVREGEVAFVTEPGVRKAAIVLFRRVAEIPLDVAGSRGM